MALSHSHGPAGKVNRTGGITAADGTMGQIIKAYIDWQLSGDQKLAEPHLAKDQEVDGVRLGRRQLGRAIATA